MKISTYRMNHILPYRPLMAAFAVLLIVGCSTTVEKSTTIKSPEKVLQPETIMPEEDFIQVIPPPQQQKYISSAAVKRLLSKSRHKLNEKKFEAAANYLERGINIAPNDPRLWQSLAKVRLEQGNYKQAKQLAVKSNILVGGDDELRAINEKIISRADRLLSP